jgi:hypothetical protein
MTNVNTNIEDKLFYFYGVKPLEKEFANFEKKVCQYLMETHGFTKFEAFQAWQIYKLNVKLMHIANFPIQLVGWSSPPELDFSDNGGISGSENTRK